MAEQSAAVTSNVIRIKSVPKTKPKADEHFELSKGEKLTDLKENEMLIESEYISVDPYQRGRMPLWVAATKDMVSFTVAKVIKSNDAKYKEGEYVYGMVSGFPLSSLLAYVFILSVF